MSPTTRVLIGIVTAVALPLAGLSLPARAGSSCALADSSALVTLYTLHIEAKPAKKTYRRGDKVKVFMEVTRPAEEDPAGNRTPMPRPTFEPAADVDVAMTLSINYTYTWDTGVTDEDGKATLLIPYPKDGHTGWARGDASAEKMHYSNNGCPDVREVGYRSYPKFVKIEP